MTMNCERYQTVLQFMDFHCCTHFLQDSMPCHASKCIKAFLAQQSFQVFGWPGNSPNLNTIENCWNHMKTMLKREDISSVPKLTTTIKELLSQELTIQYLWNLSDSMPKRLQILIEAKGEEIKY
jgi:hypothetical protein